MVCIIQRCQVPAMLRPHLLAHELCNEDASKSGACLPSGIADEDDVESMLGALRNEGLTQQINILLAIAWCMMRSHVPRKLLLKSPFAVH